MLPPQDVFDPSIVTACNQLYAKGDALIQQGAERLLQQRVTVTEVPCAKAFGNYKGKKGGFWVLGNDRTCYCPNYQKDFYGCSVMWCVCSQTGRYVTVPSLGASSPPAGSEVHPPCS